MWIGIVRGRGLKRREMGNYFDVVLWVNNAEGSPT